jgi:hypothetical protein
MKITATTDPDWNTKELTIAEEHGEDGKRNGVLLVSIHEKGDEVFRGATVKITPEDLSRFWGMTNEMRRTS